MNLDRFSRYLKTLSRVPTDEEAADMVRLSRRGFFGATAGLIASPYFAPDKVPQICPENHYNAILVSGTTLGYAPEIEVTVQIKEGAAPWMRVGSSVIVNNEPMSVVKCHYADDVVHATIWRVERDSGEIFG